MRFLKTAKEYWEISLGIFMALVISIWWVRDVSGYGPAIEGLQIAKEKQDTLIVKQGKAVTRMDYNIQIIARKIGVEPLTPEKEDDY
jgi:hypothetical protein